MTHITDHVARGLGRLLSQFEDARLLRAVLAAVLSEVQELEDVWYALLTERNLDTADGDSLDAIGAIVGEPRNGAPDATYRNRILVRIARNLSRGEPERLIKVLAALTQSSHVFYTEPSPGVAELRFNGSDLPDDLRVALESIAPVGVRLVLLHVPTTPFAFAGATQPVGPPGTGGFDTGGLSEVI